MLSKLTVTTLLTICIGTNAWGQSRLVPVGDYGGISLDQWTLNWGEWAIKTGLGGQDLPDTVGGVRYLPPNLGSTFVTDLMIEPNTAVVFSPYFVFGEKYPDGSEDKVADIDGFGLFSAATFQVKLDGTVVLEGKASDFPTRRSGVRVFADPVSYVSPQPQGPVAAIFEQGVGAIFELEGGAHSITNVYRSDFFGGPYSATYNITVVPEPTAITSFLGMLALYGRNLAVKRSRK